MVMKGAGKKGNQKEGLIKWLIFTLLYAVVIGILYGTSNYYFDVVPLLFGLYMDISLTIIILGLSGWTLLSYLILKKYKINIMGR